MIPKIFRKFRPYYLPLLYPVPATDPETNYFLSFISPDSTVAEIGANRGGSTVKIARRAKRVFAFEPHRDNFKILKAYCKGMENVELFNMGLWSEEKNLSLIIDSRANSGTTNSFLQLENAVPRGRISVTCSTVNQMLESKGIDILWIDVEGAEIEVLRGARKTLHNTKHVLVETHGTSDFPEGTDKQVWEILTGFGFNIVGKRMFDLSSPTCAMVFVKS